MARPKGSANKTTTKARAAFNALLDGRTDDLNAWIDRVAQDDPARAFAMVMTLASYCVPRPRPVEPEPEPIPPVTISFANPSPCRSCGHDPSKEPHVHITRQILNGPDRP